MTFTPWHYIEISNWNHKSNWFLLLHLLCFSFVVLIYTNSTDFILHCRMNYLVTRLMLHDFWCAGEKRKLKTVTVKDHHSPLLPVYFAEQDSDRGIRIFVFASIYAIEVSFWVNVLWNFSDQLFCKNLWANIAVPFRPLWDFTMFWKKSQYFSGQIWIVALAQLYHNSNYLVIWTKWYRFLTRSRSKPPRREVGTYFVKRPCWILVW